MSIIVATMSAIIFASVPASSQYSSCGVSPSSDWDEGDNPRDYLSIDIPGSGGGELFGFDGRSCLLYTSPSPRDQRGSRMPSSA